MAVPNWCFLCSYTQFVGAAYSLVWEKEVPADPLSSAR